MWLVATFPQQGNQCAEPHGDLQRCEAEIEVIDGESARDSMPGTRGDMAVPPPGHTRCRGEPRASGQRDHRWNATAVVADRRPDRPRNRRTYIERNGIRPEQFALGTGVTLRITALEPARWPDVEDAVARGCRAGLRLSHGTGTRAGPHQHVAILVFVTSQEAKLAQHCRVACHRS